MDTIKSPIVFCHIPKTAGASFRLMVWDLLGEEEVFPNKDELQNNGGLYLPLQAFHRLPEERKGKIRFICGHYPVSSITALGLQPATITFFRDPLERSVSYLKHYRNQVLSEQKTRLADLINKVHPNKLYNVQTRFLLASDHKYFGELGDKSYLRAEATLEQLSFIGICEQFKSSVRLFEKRFGLRFKRFIEYNVSAKLNGEQDDLLKTRERLLRYNEYDMRLYSKVKRKFEGLLNRGPPQLR